MSQDEFNVVIELEDVLVEVEELPTVDLNIDDEEVKVILVGNVGPPGEDGDPGPPGPPGPPGSDISFRYTHDQGVPSSTWNVIHNLNGYPNVTVVDSAGTRVEGEVTYDDNNSITLNFSAVFSGKAYLS